jgi:RNA polymerase sigma-70 factor (ECF subfamily)
VKVAITRMAIDEAERAREIPTEDALLEAIIDPGQGPALAHLKDASRTLLAATFREAVETLPDRERTLLVQYYLDGVGLVQLAALYGRAPSNISRTLAKTRVLLLAGMRRALVRRGMVGGAELESLVDLVGSQLSVTGTIRRRPRS